MEELPKLWIKADHDMLNNGYRLADTGQGYVYCVGIGFGYISVISIVVKFHYY